MNNIYKEKRECWLCQRTGKMHMIQFMASSPKARKVAITKKYRLYRKICPICEGNGYLQIIIKK